MSLVFIFIFLSRFLSFSYMGLIWVRERRAQIGGGCKLIVGVEISGGGSRRA